MEIVSYVVDEPFAESTRYFKIALVAFLSTFMIFSAVSFLLFRIKKKEAEYEKLVRVLGISNNEVEFSTRAIGEEYASGDYLLPLAFVTTVCLFGFSMLLFGADLVSLNPGKSNMLLTGMLPNNALIYLRERFRIFSENSNDRSHDLPLQMIEGINMFHKVRLGEVGIDNAQNLAEANVIELFLKTPFNPSQLVDWVAQAKLYVYFKEDIEKLRRIGIRTIFDLCPLCEHQEQLAQLAEEVRISKLSLEMICDRLRADNGVARLYQFHGLLSTMDVMKETSTL
ncbi:hypothetical protein sS8_3009 [Methylocaldum marinum]|uniref:Uncharacterized protein n=1 Tax=Methylocaldum marinum TaxID=1432792 RepID=A0A250KTQ6_9GAMM|nr:hypothetical protein [Methylocaldum marinum]BBA34952.1 hypothetical protein sS8_3009 [Methylocaldum marinum]